MIFKLLKYNIKKQKKTSIIVPIILGIILSITMKNITNIPNTEDIFLKDIFISLYGGMSTDPKQKFSIMDIIMFLTPHLIIIYLSQIYFTDLVKNTPRNMFLRIRSLRQWITSINISLFYIVIKYYLILYITSILTMLLYIERHNLNMYDFLNINFTNINIVIEIIILSIFTMFSIVIICNNLYFLFNKDDKPIIIFILFNTISTLLTGFGEKFNLFVIINHLMIKRHSVFQEGYRSLTLNFSLIYICLLIILNHILSLIIVKNQDF